MQAVTTQQFLHRDCTEFSLVSRHCLQLPLHTASQTDWFVLRGGPAKEKYPVINIEENFGFNQVAD